MDRDWRALTREVAVSIDRESPIPLYHQLAEQLVRAIEDGVLRPGDPLETEMALADRLDMSRPTVRRAIGELVTRGLIVRKRGVGTMVALASVHRRNELTSLYEDLEKDGLAPSTEVLLLVTDREDRRAATILGLHPKTPLVYVERLRLVDGRPIAVLKNWLSPVFADLTADVLEEHGLYALLRARGMTPAVAHQTVGSRGANPFEAHALNVKTGTPVLTMTRKAFDATGEPVEFGDHCYRADRYKFDVTVYDI
jgi:DNA-binding GntR family transcriptional regulator